MNIKHLKYLVCPESKEPLRLEGGLPENENIVKDGYLVCDSSNKRYPIINGVPRFVPRENYASGFGLEWTIHAKTQYDSYSGISASHDRFYDQTHWDDQLDGQVLLEVGSGSGRFTEQAVKTGATVISLDYSYAVDANYKSNGLCENVLIVQADIGNLPFPENTFDKLFCFGVLQHTPDPRLSLSYLPAVLKSGGSLCVDIYKSTLVRTVFSLKHYIRPFTSKMPPQKLYDLVVRYVDFMWPFASLVRKLPKGSGINWMMLVADYSKLGLKGKILKEWAYLDTFDMLSPAYDMHVSEKEFRTWGESLRLDDIETELTGHGVVMRAIKV